jgi:hypothetical protein
MSPRRGRLHATRARPTSHPGSNTGRTGETARRQQLCTVPAAGRHLTRTQNASHRVARRSRRTTRDRSCAGAQPARRWLRLAWSPRVGWAGVSPTSHCRGPRQRTHEAVLIPPRGAPRARHRVAQRSLGSTPYTPQWAKPLGFATTSSHPKARIPRYRVRGSTAERRSPGLVPAPPAVSPGWMRAERDWSLVESRRLRLTA